LIDSGVGLDGVESFIEDSLLPSAEDDHLFINTNNDNNDWEDVDENEDKVFDTLEEKPEQALLRKARLRATVMYVFLRLYLFVHFN
jgi:hypothetical protein